MKSIVLKGTKSEIATALAGVEGKVREAIVFVEEPMSAENTAADPNEDVFAEMDKHMVQVVNVDDSRDAIYTRMEDE